MSSVFESIIRIVFLFAGLIFGYISCVFLASNLTITELLVAGFSVVGASVCFAVFMISSQLHNIFITLKKADQGNIVTPKAMPPLDAPKED